MTHLRKLTNEEVNKIIELRKRGWTYQSLGFLFGVDHSSIYHLCKRFNIGRGNHEVIFDLPSVIETTQSPYEIQSILEISIRTKPLSYADYLLQLK